MYMSDIQLLDDMSGLQIILCFNEVVDTSSVAGSRGLKKGLELATPKTSSRLPEKTSVD